MSKVLSGRVPDALADEVAAYARRRGVKRAVIVEAACRYFLDFAKSGVPDLPERGEQGQGRPREAESAGAVGGVAVAALDVAAIRAKAAAAAAARRAGRS